MNRKFLRILRSMCRRFPQFPDYEMVDLISGCCTVKQAVAIVLARQEVA
jgi:hypothetical protein